MKEQMLQQIKTQKHVGHFFFVVAVFFALVGITLLAPMSATITKAFGVSDIIDLSNQSRDSFGLDPLQINTALMNAAQMKAEDMAAQHYFAHTAPDGTVAWDYLNDVGYKYSKAGENLAITNEDAQAVVNGWLNSPTHRDNLLSTDYADFGIGLAYFGDYKSHTGTYVIVALYGKSAAVQVLTAATVPAGISTSLKPQLLSGSPLVIGVIAGVLALVGIVLELKHIKRLHRMPLFG